ncbi:MAG: iron-containing alcohol dehydrogenase [Treponema sp.]|jgi:alcohol dehydrogenase|nr:iron-containing alcohol dehydrogenase [Treponema sp.]
MDISFRLDPEILIGPDTVNRAGTICSRIGGRVLVATEQVLYEKKSIERLVDILEDSGVEVIVFDEIPAQATADVAETAASLARGARCSSIIGFGGLKTQTIARLTAIMTPSRLSIFELLDGRKNEDEFLPYIAIPTTGRDPFIFADYFIAVDPRDRSVKMVKTPPRLCTAAIIDGNLSESLSDAFAATTAFDGFCAAVEAYCSSRANFLSDSLLEQAISLYAQMINFYSDINQSFDLVGGSTNAGLLMSLGSAVSAPGIGTALSYAINGRFPVAKSWSSTVLLPYILEKLVTARPEKIAKVAALMGEPVEGASVSDSANMAVDSIRRRMGILKVPARLKEFGLSLDRLIPVAESARSIGFVSFSPWTVSGEDAFDLLKQAF